jgi:hypothetical protein
MSIELTTLTCDTCGQRILTVEDGYVEWLGDEMKDWGWKIIHAVEAMPQPYQCYAYSRDTDNLLDYPLSDFMGDKLQTTIDGFVQYDKQEFDSFLKRLH